MKRRNFNPMLLQLFAEASSDTGVTASDAGMQGVNETTADTAAQVSENRDAEFLRLIQGPYKDLYDARVQDIVQKRLKSQQKTLEQYQSLEPMLNQLADRFGVTQGDWEALSRAMAENPSTAPSPVHQKKAKAQYDQWIRQAQEAQRMFPGLQLQQEVRNPGFLRLLDQGLCVQDAYFLTHRDQIIPAAMHRSARAVEETLASRIAANASRPMESGMITKGAAVTKSDVSQMSRAQRQAIISRVGRGERIHI